MSNLLDQMISDEKILAAEICSIKLQIEATNLANSKLIKGIDELKREIKQKEDETEQYQSNKHKQREIKLKILGRKCPMCKTAYNFICQTCKHLTCGKCNKLLKCTNCIPSLTQNWAQIKYAMNNI